MTGVTKANTHTCLQNKNYIKIKHKMNLTSLQPPPPPSFKKKLFIARFDTFFENG